VRLIDASDALGSLFNVVVSDLLHVLPLVRRDMHTACHTPMHHETVQVCFTLPRSSDSLHQPPLIDFCLRLPLRKRLLIPEDQQQVTHM
jgi:hypothetical protein